MGNSDLVVNAAESEKVYPLLSEPQERQVVYEVGLVA
jgi:hypothetical protein